MAESREPRESEPSGSEPKDDERLSRGNYAEVSSGPGESSESEEEDPELSKWDMMGIPDDDMETKTSRSQEEMEDKCREVLNLWDRLPLWPKMAPLRRQEHAQFAVAGLKNLPQAMTGLDASRGWLSYWMLHSLELLGFLDKLSEQTVQGCIEFLRRCQSPRGGFGGGPMQYPLLAGTYAAISSLCIIGASRDRAAFRIIDRKALLGFLLRIKHPCGGFRMTEDGEVDTRCSYLALSVARMTNILTPELTEGCAEWLLRCQTYEGGFSARPGEEAHGGYSFCGFAALCILGQQHRANVPRLAHWAAFQQHELEGGFRGRTNKLVDSCYSFWVAGLFPLIEETTNSQRKEGKHGALRLLDNWLFDREALQRYLLLCCQVPTRAGLRDKPGMNPDFYHTCYALSGLSVAQNHPGSFPEIVGRNSNLLAALDVLSNISEKHASISMRFFEELPDVSSQSAREFNLRITDNPNFGGESEDESNTPYQPSGSPELLRVDGGSEAGSVEIQPVD